MTMGPIDGPGQLAPDPLLPARFDAVEAVAYGWRAFRKDPGHLLVPVLLGSLAQGIIITVLYAAFIAAIIGAVVGSGANSSDGIASDSPGGIAMAAIFVLGAIIFLALFLVFQIVYAGWVKGGLDATQGRTSSLGELYSGWAKGPVVMTAGILGLGVFIGSRLWWIPSLAVLVLFQFTMLFLLDQNMKPVDALRSSYQLVIQNAGQVLFLDILCFVLFAAGVALCGLGTLVATPVIVIALAYAYRVLAGRGPLAVA